MQFQSINPATETLEATYDSYSPERVDQALDQARATFTRWRATPLEERSHVMQQLAATLRAQKTDLATLATREMGKTITEAEAEIEKCAWVCDYYAANAATFLADMPAPSSASDSYVAFLPLGVVLAIMPWNFPFWQVFRFLAPALMAGNTAVLKHASNVSGCALAIERVVRDAGLPTGVFATLLVPSSDIEAFIADPRIAAVTLTGSEPAGMSVAAASGHALKKTVLELGGSDAFIVLADADLDAAAQYAARARFQNAGQSCIAAKRFIVVADVVEAFTARFVAEAERWRVGDPLARTSQMGPLARGDLRDALEQQVRVSAAEGAQVALGGMPLPGPGYFYPPTILTHVTTRMPVFQEETFGPVAAIISARDTADAVALANQSSFGLGGNLWTRDIAQARHLARQLESGAVFINGMTASDPRLPFGGVKRSGYGRELSAFGIREFVNIQTVWIGPPRAEAAAEPASE